VEGRKSRVKSRGRESKVEVEGQKSRVESRKYLIFIDLNAAKRLVLLSKLKNFAYGYAVRVWLYVLYN
jgi:hypothetical protein